jgi:hypothetical protein
MTATIGLLGLLSVGLLQVQGTPPRAIDKPVTLTATIEKIDAKTRTVTLKGKQGNLEVAVAEDMQGFNTLKVGDVVTATYYEALALQIRRPGDPPASTTPIVTSQRKEGSPNSERRRQQTFTVSIEAIDLTAETVRVKGPAGRVLTVVAADPKQLQRLKVGDQVDVTYYETLLVEVKKAK